jgi:hypothetical protein
MDRGWEKFNLGTGHERQLLINLTARYNSLENGVSSLIGWFGWLLCLTPLSAIFQLYHGDKIWWWKKIVLLVGCEAV